MPTAAEISELLGLQPEHDRQGRAVWWLRNSPPAAHARAGSAGLTPLRRLHRMGIALPPSRRVEVRTRPFEPGRDEEGWLEVNNLAFAWHPDQSGWSLADIRRKEQEPWFDAEGFLLHEDDDAAIDAFCWTKVHDHPTPPTGEIFVIGVRPDRHGTGLGRAMSLAGLWWLFESRDIRVGMLYVEAGNEAAIDLYLSIGFRFDHDDVAYGLPGDG